MRPRKTEAEKKRLGRPSYRTFHNQMGFQISETLHIEISNIAHERDVRFEDIYAEAVLYLLEERSIYPILYTPAPTRRRAKRVTIHIEPSLEERVRITSQEDQQRLVDFFQTAAWLYLEQLGRLPERISRFSSQL